MIDSHLAPPVDRRQSRSENPQVALTRLLEATRKAAALEALAVADDLGLLMAGAGAAELCDELAALSPLVGVANDTEMSVRRLAVDGFEIFISGRGAGLDLALGHIAAGCSRILVEKKSRLAR